MIAILRLAAIAFAAALLGWSTSVSAALPTQGVPASGYLCDSHHDTADAGTSAAERGPPTACDPAATRDAVDLRSHGRSARSETTATYGYNAQLQLAAIANNGIATREPARAKDGELSAFAASQVAANAGSKLLPKVDDVFRFPGAGRSGAGVKNFVGPPNTIARGASPGRVFVTDDQGRVIFDITRDRVKPVVPGQGFVSGDGRKLAPTPEQLGWIDELWGG